MSNEETHLPSFLATWVLVPILPLILILYFLSHRHSKLPPGPRKLPIIGNMNIMDQLTHRGLAKLAEVHGGVFHLRLGFNHTVVISSPEVARQVLQVHDHIFSNRPATAAIRYLSYDRSDMAFALYGPFWRQMRKLCVVKLFSRRRSESWASVRDEVDAAVSTVAAVPPGQLVNVGELVFHLAKNITYRAAFGSSGNEGEEQDKFIAIMQEFSKLFGAFNLADFVPWLEPLDLQGIKKRLVKARGELDSFIDRIIDDHMANPKEMNDPNADLVDDMLAFVGETGGGKASDDLQASLRLSRNNIKAIIMDVMFGGTETVASAIEWTMAELMRSPVDMKRLQAELSAVVGLHRKVREGDLEKLPYLKCCVKETLRLHPPIPVLLHETAEEAHLNGFRIPAKTRVMINAWGIGRDRKAWDNADAFLPSRFEDGEIAAPDFKGSSFEFIPFGSGRRSCPGMQLGLYGLELAVAQLLHCFSWELPDGMKPSEMDMEDVFGLTAPKAVRLFAVPTPRLSCPL